MASDSSDSPEAPDGPDALPPDPQSAMTEKKPPASQAARKARPVKKPATYQDVLDAPPNMVAEVLGGALYTFPRPASPHGRAASSLGVRLGGPFDYDRGGPGGWWILDEPELHLGDDIVVPDLAGWRRERMPAIPDVAYFSQSPDWVCEVLSPSTRALDEGAKKTIYAREGVTHIWHVDPLARWLAAYALREGRYALIRKLTGDVPVSLPPFDAIEFSLGDLWLSPAKP